MKPTALAVATALLLTLHATAGTPVEVARGDKASQPRQPQVAVDEDGAIHLVYGVNNSVRYCRSDDQGKSYSAPTELPSLGALSLGMRRGPRIVAFDGRIAVTAIGGPLGKGQDGNVLCYRSADAGVTWSAPIVVNDVADSAREGLHGMSAGPDGTVCCVWLDLRHKKSEVMAATSVDAGATWSKNVLVYRSPDGSVCECCHPSVAWGANGVVHVMWRNSLSGNRDMYVAKSTDGGVSFGTASKLGAETWPLDACPMDGGAITCTAAYGVSAVWRREGKVYLLTQNDSPERLLGDGEQPWIAASPKGVYVVWLKNRAEEAFILRPGELVPTQLTSQAYDPVVAASPTLTGPVVAAWEGRDETGAYIILCEVVGQ
ncbi:MAG: sialidase family protein [Planctomycetia bacterium]|nr:sialidase family protein [Planctomycetia bacterium]